MLKYKFKTYYPKYVERSDLFHIGDYNSASYLYEAPGYNDKTFYKINLINCIQSFALPTSDYNLGKLIKHLNRKDGRSIPELRLESTNINYLFTALTNAMFLKELEKHKDLLSPSVYIVKNSKFVNFNAPIGASGHMLSMTSFEDKMNFEKKYSSSQLLREGICDNINYNQGLYIVIKKDAKITLNDYEELIFLYLKCAIICSKKTLEYENLIGCLLHKINAPRITHNWYNSIKKTQSISTLNLQNVSIKFYSKSKLEENVYMHLNKGCFISKFNTYSNLKSIEEETALVARFDRCYEDKLFKYKIIISSNLLEYFSFLKKNKKNELYTEDYNKLNKVLNAIKSIATLQNIEIEFGNIEEDIHNIEVTIDKTNIVEVLMNQHFDLIPKNVNQALEIKGIFDELLDNLKCSKEFSRKYAFNPSSSYSPLSGYTKEQMEDIMIEDEIPF